MIEGMPAFGAGLVVLGLLIAWRVIERVAARRRAARIRALREQHPR